MENASSFWCLGCLLYSCPCLLLGDFPRDCSQKWWRGCPLPKVEMEDVAFTMCSPGTGFPAWSSALSATQSPTFLMLVPTIINATSVDNPFPSWPDRELFVLRCPTPYCSYILASGLVLWESCRHESKETIHAPQRDGLRSLDTRCWWFP
jgi:hypothetical protein